MTKKEAENNIEPDLVYENYKLPLKKVENKKGYGYYGCIAMTRDGMFIQCHICGELFTSLGGHLRKHNTTAKEYREQYELASTTSLVSDEYREKLQEKAVKQFDGTLPEHLSEYNKKVSSGDIKHAPSYDRKKAWSLERRNKEGLCPDQLLEKIKELASELGRTPSEDEFREHYKKRFYSSIYYIFGSYLKAVKKAGLVSAQELKSPSDEKLLQDLQDFHEIHGRIPMNSDFARGLLRPRAMYFRRFGSLNNARIEAGLNAVIPMPFGQIVELSQEQYIEYKNRKPGKVRHD